MVVFWMGLWRQFGEKVLRDWLADTEEARVNRTNPLKHINSANPLQHGRPTVTFNGITMSFGAPS